MVRKFYAAPSLTVLPNHRRSSTIDCHPTLDCHPERSEGSPQFHLTQQFPHNCRFFPALRMARSSFFTPSPLSALPDVCGAGVPTAVAGASRSRPRAGCPRYKNERTIPEC